MGQSTFPSSSSSIIKSIQRGSTASAGTVAISTINVSKSFIHSFSNGSTGTIGTNSSTSGTYTPSGGNIGQYSQSFNPGSGSYPNLVGTRSFSGGTTSLRSASYGAYISGPSSVTTTGACRWEVVEYV